MTCTEYPYAGLILPDTQDLDPDPYLDTAARVVAQLDPRQGRAPQRGSNAVMGRSLGIQVISEEDSDYGPRVLIEVITRAGGLPTEDQDEAAAQLLSAVVLAALEHSSADILEWYSPDVLLDREDFIRLRSYVSPRRAEPVVRSVDEVLNDVQPAQDYSADDHLADDIRGALYPAGEEDERPAVTDRLAQYRIQTAEVEPEQSRMSAAGWLLTGALAIINLPLAVFVGIMNGGRGVDLRLVSQALAVTGLFTVLYHTDRLHQVARLLIH
ncbi:hypothetical protein [Tropicibacter naphthalenivorans]|uniref:Uncharacterized protein n=1 Tax=Tropicibacter naphthalenivorans TaxID=441103 RepID=A0A0P1GZ77_9RHOB|nr:hypothetical protein [Tropicibacter naphthalenivorans]CUH80055.1 hypothetical protein TRN7648_02774 [Tropicibacter naphthalenivorans]SMC84134.1 hypothetical protein SAMN04488093_10543 [Tropicibacter naphthalenivorans]